MPVISPMLPAVLLTNQLWIRSSHDPFLKFDDLLGWLRELRKVLYFLLLVYYERYNWEVAKGRRCIGQGMEGRGLWRRHRASMPFLSATPSHPVHQYLDVYDNWKFSEPCDRGFYGSSITWAWLILSLAIDDWTPSLAPLLFLGDGGTEGTH